MAKYDFFISYSSKDKDIAFRIVNAIESAGYTCWIAPRNIPYGTPYARAIMEGIDECDKFIVLITKSSVQSNDVLNEVDNAHSVKKTIIPVRLTDTQLSRELNYYLSRTQWLTLPSSNPEEIVKLLNIENKSSPTQNQSKLNDSSNTNKNGLRINPILLGGAIVMIAIAVVMCLCSGPFTHNEEDVNQSKEIVDDNLSSQSEDDVDAMHESSSEKMTQMDLHQNNDTKSKNTINQSSVVKKESYKELENKEELTEIGESQSSPNDTEDYKQVLFEANAYYNNADYDKALPLYIRIATNFDINYADKVGWMYENAQGTKSDLIKAAEWYKKAADAGNTGAMNRLATLYVRGEKFKEAVEYYLRAEKQSALFPNSQYWLGYIYFNGLDGIPKDLNKAKNYWTSAAKAGLKGAQVELERNFSE